MKLKYIKFGLLILAGALINTGCSDFLDTEQRGVTSQDNFYKTDAEINQGLMAIYDGLQSDNVTTFQFKNLLSDDAIGGGGGRGDNRWGEEMDEFTFGSTNNMVRTQFTRYYQIVYKANLLISKVPNPDTDFKKLAIAEAKTLRAYAYFELTTLWGTTPLVTAPLNPGEYAQPNATLAELWNQIETDLKDAIAVLPLKSQLSAAKKGNVSKGTAQAWLGKAYLYQKKYDDAAAQFDLVISSGEYSLNPNFAAVTRESSEFGTESVFEISFTKDLSSPIECTNIVAYCGPRSPWFKGGTSGISETAWGWCEPDQDLWDAFIAAGDVVRRNGTLMSEAELIALGGSFRNNGNANLPYGTYGLIRLKHGSWVAETPGEAYHTISGTNYRITRYSDVLLMAAEAYNRKSAPNDVKALGYINQVRQRAQLPNLTSTGSQLFADLKTERRLELAFEFVRYQDLIRWGDAATVLANEGKSIPKGDGTYFSFPNAGFKAKNILLPFPDAEISVNKKITQNTGW